ncbi:hypothetical protein DBB29_00680 [Pandoraea cepalis]|uniref:Antitoxin n=1 Tax=Pandoraea cepalis TaxID=2508294 RepID=A0AAW7MGX7_9BURK|nr:hypothetical protein [Pandoraea cepalis]MDN4571997.1 hypothetical protein [Pandoraea cepalis]MDN4576648.1 hypothetical protein [Pandoraea cepalis]
MSSYITDDMQAQLEREAIVAGAVFEDAVADLDVFDSQHDEAWSAEDALTGALAREVGHGD